MNFTDIFAEYYTLYRGDSDVPDITDPEWSIAVRYANTALRRLQEVDGEIWEWLWTTVITDGETLTYSGTGNAPVITTYDCPTNMLRPGGFVRLTDPVSGSYFNIDVVPNYDVQLVDGGGFAWFTGGPQTGFTLHISLSGNSYVNYAIDFPYYKKITLYNAASNGAGGVQETGSTISECPDPNYIINYILAYRFRASRNYPSYQTAQKDAETALQGMQIKNRMGVDGHGFNLNDSNQSGQFGI